MRCASAKPAPSRQVLDLGRAEGPGGSVSGAATRRRRCDRGARARRAERRSSAPSPSAATASSGGSWASGHRARREAESDARTRSSSGGCGAWCGSRSEASAVGGGSSQVRTLVRPWERRPPSNTLAPMGTMSGRWPDAAGLRHVPDDGRGGRSPARSWHQSLPGRCFGSSTSEARPTASPPRGELDRVLGGGLVPASLVLVGGEPGGESTLLLQCSGRSRSSRRGCS